MLAKIKSHEIVKVAGTIRKRRNPLGNRAERRHSRPKRGLAEKTILGEIMILREVVIAGAALGAVAAFALVSQPAQAGGCVVVTAKARGVIEAGANKRSHDKLTRNINHWAKKNGLKAVRVGYAQTSCSKGPVFTCTVSAKACP